MLGTSAISVSPEQMCKIVQHWLEAKTLQCFMKDTLVTSVAENTTNGAFDIVLQNTKTEEINPISLRQERSQILKEGA